MCEGVRRKHPLSNNRISERLCLRQTGFARATATVFSHVPGVFEGAAVVITHCLRRQQHCGISHIMHATATAQDGRGHACCE